MKTLNTTEIETVAGGINPLLLPAIVIYLPKIPVEVPQEAPTVD